MRKLAGAVVFALAALIASAQWSNPGDNTPAYFNTTPAKPWAAVLSGAQLTGPYFAHPYQVTAYKMAAAIPQVLFAQPCYCRCDREMGHQSLHSCFEGLHGAACSTCMKEGVFAYQQTRLGRTPAQIRSAIERGEWMKLNLEDVKM